MGLKAWLLKNTSSPSGFGWDFALGLMEMIGYLASSVVVFGGSRAAGTGTSDAPPHVFQTHFDMESAGFDSFETNIAVLVAPDLELAAAVANPEICGKAFRTTAAFLCLLSQKEAFGCMKRENGRAFSDGLYASLATCCAGRFGFEQEPREVWNAIRNLVPTLRRDRILDEDQPGRGDGFGALLLPLSASADGRTEYAFVTGSRNQAFGCATALVRVWLEIHEALQESLKDVGW